MLKSKKIATRNRNFLMIGAALVAIALFYGIYSYKNLWGGQEGEIVAHINGKPVYNSEARETMKAMLGNGDADSPAFQSLDENSKMAVLREVAAQRLLTEKARKEDFENKKELEQKVNQYRDNLLKQQFLTNMAKEAITEEKLQERYKEISEDLKGRQQFKVSHILTDSEEKAKNLSNALKRNKSNFEKLAKENSIDKVTAADGGNLGYILSGNVDEQFEEAVNKLKPGEISEPVHTRFGWHIIRLDEKKPAKVASYENLKAKIAQDIYQEKLQEYIDSLLENTKITVAQNEKEKEKDNDKDKEEEAGELEKVEPSAEGETK